MSALSMQTNIYKKIKVQYVPEVAQFLSVIKIKIINLNYDLTLMS